MKKSLIIGSKHFNKFYCSNKIFVNKFDRGDGKGHNFEKREAEGDKQRDRETERERKKKVR